MFDQTIMMERDVSVCMCHFCRPGQRSGRNDVVAEDMRMTLASAHACEIHVLVQSSAIF